MSCVRTSSPRSRPWRGWRLLTLIALALYFAACSATPQRPARPILMNTLVCAKVPPPSFPAIVTEGIQEDGCPVNYVCLSKPSAGALAIWLRMAMEWMAETYVRCGPLPGGPIPHMQDG